MFHNSFNKINTAYIIICSDRIHPLTMLISVSSSIDMNEGKVFRIITFLTKRQY